MAALRIAAYEPGVATRVPRRSLLPLDRTDVGRRIWTARALLVPECGHDDRCIFTTNLVLEVLFPPGA